MPHLLCPLLWAGCLPCWGGGDAGSFLYRPSYCMDHALRGPALPYAPQPGDIVFSTTESAFMRAAHRLAGAADPHHSGIVVARSDGRLAVLEAGPHNTLYVELIDVLPHLESYARSQRVWVRRRCVPLTPEQSARLTAYAEAQVGKRFAWGRLLAQLTPFRTRGPLRTRWVGRPHGERRGYFCSELVLEACLAAGLLDPAVIRPAATYPRDLFFNHSPNHYLDRTLRLGQCWEPPARWTDCPAR